MPDVYLIAGSNGMLGTALQRVLAEGGVRFVAPGEGSFDITDPRAVDTRVREFTASLAEDERGVLVNAAAYTNVERAEDEPASAYQVNEYGAQLLAEAAHTARLTFVHVSTDFVFDGRKQGAYAEDDEPAPLSVYGASKLAGERAVECTDQNALIVRTAWVFGPAGVNFPVKILAAARERGELTVVDDEVGSPTYTIDLARGIIGLVEAGATGLYHLAGAGSATRFALAEEVLRTAGVDVPMHHARSADFPMHAERPANSVLDCSKAAALGVRMPEWRDAVARFIADGV